MVTCGVFSIISAVSPASAQESRSTSQVKSAPDHASKSDSPKIDEIIVTAQKRSESVQSVPASITAVSSASLEQRQLRSSSDLQFVVPSMIAGTLKGETAISIRGVGLNQGSPGVAVHADGIYQPRPTMGSLSQIDVERVEVLRGPQGTLYGRNANGGVINYISKAPTSNFEGSALASYESFDEYHLQAVVNVPVNDRIRARLVVHNWERSDGFVKNVIPGNQDLDKGKATEVRLRVAIDLSDTLRADLIGTYAHRTGPFQYFTLTSQPSAVTFPEFTGAIVPTQPRTTAQNDPATTRRNYAAFTGNLSWELGDFTVKSLTSYQSFRDNFTGDFDATNLSVNVFGQKSLSKTFTQEVNISGNFGPVSGVVGAFYMHDKFDEAGDFSFPRGSAGLPPGSSLHQDNHPYVSRTFALFADATVDLSDRIHAFAGVRYNEDKQRTTQNNFLVIGGAFTVPICPNRTNSVDFNSVTPRAGLKFDVADQSHLYASYSKGFKSGGFNYRSGCGNLFKPEKLTSYEIGWKNRFLDDALTLNATAFYYDYRDLQVEQLVGLSFNITNADKARVMGLELESTYRIDDHFTVNGNISLIEAEFTKFNNLDSLNPALGVQDLKGNPIANAPKVLLNFGASYKTDPVIAGGYLSFRADLNYRSRVYFREFKALADSQAPNALLSASVAWTSEDDKYSVRVFGKNLTGRNYYSQLAQATSLGSRFISWGAPRQIGVEVKAGF
jgi:iron complex outermembrane receptor protein